MMFISLRLMEEGLGEHAYNRMVLFACCKIITRLGTLTLARIKYAIEAAPYLERYRELWNSSGRDILEVFRWVKSQKRSKKRKNDLISQSLIDDFFGNS